MRMQEPRPGNRGNMLKSKDWRPKLREGQFRQLAHVRGCYVFLLHLSEKGILVLKWTFVEKETLTMDIVASYFKSGHFCSLKLKKGHFLPFLLWESYVNETDCSHRQPT